MLLAGRRLCEGILNEYLRVVEALELWKVLLELEMLLKLWMISSPSSTSGWKDTRLLYSDDGGQYHKGFE